MTILNPPGYLQAGSYSALMDRLNLISCRFIPTGASTFAMTARGGFLPGQSQRLANHSISTWDVTIGAFAAVVENTLGAQAGEYIVLNTSNVVASVAASSPTTNRIDIIGVRVQDAFYTGALNQADVVVVAGTPTAGTPSDPPLPLAFLPIVRVTVNAASSVGVLTDMRKRTTLMGAVYQPYTPQLSDTGTVIGETQLLPAAGPYPARLRTWDGSVWRGVTTWAFNAPTFTANAGFAPNTSHIAASVSVSDPGFQYRLNAGGSLHWSMVAATQPNWPIAVSVTNDDTNWNSGIVAYGVAYSVSIPANQTQASANAMPRHTGDLSGAHTIRIIARNLSLGQNMAILTTPAPVSNALTVELIPS